MSDFLKEINIPKVRNLKFLKIVLFKISVFIYSKTLMENRLDFRIPQDQLISYMFRSNLFLTQNLVDVLPGWFIATRRFIAGLLKTAL